MYSAIAPRSHSSRARQARAAGHQQRHGVADVVIGLGEEGDVARQRDLAGERLLDDRRGEQHVALGHGLVLELLEEAHVSVSSLKEVKWTPGAPPSAPLRGR